MKPYIIILLLLISVFSSAQIELTREKSRELALKYSRQIAISSREKDKAVFSRKSYRANFFPKLSANGMYMYRTGDLSYTLPGGYLPTYVPSLTEQKLVPNLLLDPAGNPVIGPDGNPVFKSYAFMPDVNMDISMNGVGIAGLTLEQPVYMGGKIRTASDMAKTGEALADENIRFNRAKVLSETDAAYWQYVRVKEKLEVAVKYRSLLEQLVKQLSDAYSTGMISRNDLLKAEVKKNEAGLMVQKAENGLELARMNLCRVTGLPYQTDIVVNDTLPVVPSAEVLTAQENIDNRPEYKMLEKNIELKEKEIKLVRSDYLPQVGVGASYSYIEGPQLNDVRTSDDAFSAMATVKIPIFGWGEGRNKVNSAKADYEISKLKMEDARELMELELAKARFNLKDAQSRVKMTQLSLKQAEENMRVSKNMYELGEETLTDYLEAQVQWQKAKSELIEAKAELKLSETEYLKAIGKLE
ncbi:MAG: TolC family protein [Chlorobi bacterium]|nr:TolC family protein [Chlorobiota bacterium]